MPGRRTCVWFRLAYLALAAWVCLAGVRYVMQDRYEVVGVRQGYGIVFDHRYGQYEAHVLPAGPDRGMIVPRSGI